jgi:hypothetical protein
LNSAASGPHISFEVLTLRTAENRDVQISLALRIHDQQSRVELTEHAWRVLGYDDALDHLAISTFHRVSQRHHGLGDRVPSSLGDRRVDPQDLVYKGVQVRQAVEVVPAKRPA